MLKKRKLIFLKKLFEKYLYLESPVYREALAFATEPVFASLANVLGDHTNVPTPVPSEITEFKLFDVEIKHGIIQVRPLKKIKIDDHEDCHY